MVPDCKVVGWQLIGENDLYIKTDWGVKSNCVGFVSNIVSQQKHSQLSLSGQAKPIRKHPRKMIEEIFLKKNLKPGYRYCWSSHHGQFVDDVRRDPRGSIARDSSRISVQERETTSAIRNQEWLPGYHVVVSTRSLPLLMEMKRS